MEEIVQFLARVLPWNALPEARLRAVASSMLVEYFARGTRILDAGAEVPEFLFIIRIGTIDILQPSEGGERIAGRLEEGDAFDCVSVAERIPPALRAVAREDCLIYLLPRDELQRLLELPQIRLFFLGRPGERLRAQLERSHPFAARDPFGGLAGESLSRLLVRCPPATTIIEAARLMRDSNVSSVIVDTEPPGIVTDRDLRCRVVAAGLASDVPVSAVMSQPLLSIEADGTLLEALLLMLERGVHHLAVSRGGRPVGLLTDTDLLHRLSRGPIRLPRLLEPSSPPEELACYRKELQTAVAALWRRGVSPSAINRATTLAHDAAIRRLLASAQQALGPAPAAFGLLALGSHGRMEVALRHEHSSALVYDDAAPSDAGEYFDALMQAVAQALEACGFPCSRSFEGVGKLSLCQPLALWRSAVCAWATAPGTPEQELTAEILDARQIAGELQVLGATRSSFRRAGAGEAMRRYAIGSGTDLAPPIDVLRRQLLEADGKSSERFDIESRAARPLGALARLWALEAGDEATTTTDRLQRAGAARIIERKLAEALVAADEWIAALRLRRRVDGTASESSSPDVLVVEELGGVERIALKDVFGAVSAAQRLVRGRRRAPVEAPWT